MRTLSRPMFNMGGPIKQGVMNGIREPYRGGGKAALVGDPAYPKTDGREHHFAVTGTIATVAAANAARIAAQRAAMRYGPRAVNYFKNIFKGTGAGEVTGGGGLRTAGEYARTQMAPLSRLEKIKSWFGSAPAGKYLAGSPEGRFLSGAPGKLGWVGGKIGSTAKGLAKSPLTVGAGALYGVPWGYKKLFGKDEVPPPTGIMKPGGYPEAGAEVIKEKAVLSQSQKDAFAKSQREKRVNKYLDLMGYDRSKKLAIADALIDASKIVGERGTLDPKNITQELINPIIQATSKRLDKPQQIREAVGLMMTKAGLEKEMYEAKPGTVLKNVQDMVKSGKFTEKEAWAAVLKEPKGPSDVITSHMASKRGSLDAGDLAIIMRDYGAKNDVPVGVMTKADIISEYGEGLKKYPSAMEIIKDRQITDDGIYVIGKEVIQITGGKPLQLA